MSDYRRLVDRLLEQGGISDIGEKGQQLIRQGDRLVRRAESLAHEIFDWQDGISELVRSGGVSESEVRSLLRKVEEVVEYAGGIDEGIREICDMLERLFVRGRVWRYR